MQNYSNGIFAIGIFVGFLLAILAEPLTKIMGIDIQIWQNETLLGVIVGGAISILTALAIYQWQTTAEAVRVATAIQIRLHFALLTMTSIKNACDSAIEEAKAMNSGIIHFSAYLKNPMPEVIDFSADPKELSLLMEILETTSKADSVHIWISISAITKNYQAITTTVTEMMGEAGIPTRRQLVDGDYTVSKADFEKMNGRLMCLGPRITEILEDANNTIDLIFSLLIAIQDGLDRKTGKSPKFLQILKDQDVK